MNLGGGLEGYPTGKKDFSQGHMFEKYETPLTNANSSNCDSKHEKCRLFVAFIIV